MILFTSPRMNMEQKESSETSAYKIQTAGSYPEESIRQRKEGHPNNNGNNQNKLTKQSATMTVVVK
jgi:hypothetical protein